MNNKGEILAPAGSFESVVAAVRCGADAVYLGTKDFNARINAENFDYEELEKTIKYCHARGVKVHITLNTLISDDEMPKALALIKHVCQLGADMLILQDLGVALLARKCAKDIERHASTQMSVQTVSGVQLLEALGFKEAVLPRELTKEEIETVRKYSKIKLECFVHGALCMCVSGQCYLSSMIGGRSGNRGLCAQPCRLPFSANGTEGYDLSLKDLSLVNSIKELSNIGIDTFKIEGRMKRPEYVAAAVSCVKSGLDGEIDKDLYQSLSAVFSRSGFTDGYYKDKRGKEMFGIRRKEDVTSATSKVFSSLQRLYDKERAKIPVDFLLSVYENEPVSLSATANGKTVFVSESYIPEKALNKPSTKEGLAERLSKCGGTFFFSQKVEIFLDDGLIVPASVINSLRRRALDELENQLSDIKEKPFTDFPLSIEPHKASKPLKFNVRIANIQQIPTNFENVENLYVPLLNGEKYVEKVKNASVSVGVEVPRGIFGMEKYVFSLLLKAKENGIGIAYCSTLDAVALALKAKMEVHTGFSLNVYNSLSVRQLEELGVKSLTLSPEMTLSKLSAIGGKVKRGIIAYGRLPLMLTRNCPVKNATTCEECKKKGYLTDRMGIRFPVTCNFSSSEVLNSRPIYMADRLSEIKNMDFITLYFTKESKESVDAVIDAYKKEKKFSGEFTRGLYYRDVQ